MPQTLHLALLASPHRTADAAEADFFFVPVWDFVGFGWGSLSMRLAETVGCKVVGLTLSREQKALAEERVAAAQAAQLRALARCELDGDQCAVLLD